MVSNLNVLALATEILQAIGSLLNTSDVANLRLVCKRLSDTLESTVFQHIALNVSRNNFSKSIPKLRALAAGRWPAAARTTTHLTLICFAPSSNPSSSQHATLDETNQKPSPPEVAEAERRLKKYLSDGIIALERVQNVSWLTHREDTVWVQNTILKALKKLPHLRSLYLDATFLKVAPALHRLPHLKDIAIVMKGQPAHNPFLDATCLNLAKLIACDTHISRLCISPNPGTGDQNDNISLHSLLSCYPQDTPPLRLQHISLKNMLVKFDAITLRHMQCLRSLDLSHILDPGSFSERPLSMSDLPTSADSATYEVLRFVGSTPRKIWDSLSNSGIHLEEITLTQVTSTFLRYLESYSTLRKLTLSIPAVDDENSVKHATRFWKQSIRNHINTLQTLHVEATSDGSWCLGEHNLPIIAKFRGLTSLQVSLPSNTMPLQTSKKGIHSVLDPSNLLVNLIDNVSCYLPVVRRLGISASRPTNTPGHYENDATDHDINALVIRSVEEYIAPPACKQLPDVTVINSSMPNSTPYTVAFIPERRIGPIARFESGEWCYKKDDA